MSILKNAKHEHFATLISRGVTPEEAYRTAGYKGSGDKVILWKLQNHKDVLQRIAELVAIKAEQVAEKTGVDRAWVIEQLVENVKMAKQAVPVLNTKGEETGEYKQELGAANKALELIGREIGMFVERKEIRTGRLDNMDHDDLKVLNDALAQLASNAGNSLALSESGTRH